MTDRNDNNYSSWQLWSLVILRVAIGWHFLYEGFSKLVNPDWSSLGYLMDSGGWFRGIFLSMACNHSILSVLDFLNIWGLILIGIGLVLGLFTRVAIITGMALLGFYYLSHPPVIGISYLIPSEGNYLWINKNLIELITLWVILLFPTWKIAGMDRFIFKRDKI
jgi:thiosulfate dehydrogenase [quinone] large subunit